MEMTREEILSQYRTAKDKKHMIAILAQLNGVSQTKIKQIVEPAEFSNTSARHRDKIEKKNAFRVDFGKRLDKMISGMEVDKKDFANKANISYTALFYYTTGERTPDIFTLCKLADALNVSTDELLGVTDVQ